MSFSGILHQASTSPDVGVVTLIPVDATNELASASCLTTALEQCFLQSLTSRNPRESCPGTSKHDIVFSVVEIV